MKELAKSSLKDFINELASDSPSPGGGSAAALTTALGVALFEMVARINLKKSKTPTATKRIAWLKKTRTRLLRLVTLDVQAFLKINRHYKLPKNNPRRQSSLEYGASVPLEICELSLAAARLGVEEKSRTSAWLTSDLLEAMKLVKAGYAAARLNVEINLKGLANNALRSRIASRLKSLESQIESLARTLDAGTAS